MMQRIPPTSSHRFSGAAELKQAPATLNSPLAHVRCPLPAFSGALSPRLPPLTPKQLEVPTELKWALESLTGASELEQRLRRPSPSFAVPRSVLRPLAWFRSPSFGFQAPRLVFEALAWFPSPSARFVAPRLVPQPLAHNPVAPPLCVRTFAPLVLKPPPLFLTFRAYTAGYIICDPTRTPPPLCFFSHRLRSPSCVFIRRRVFLCLFFKVLFYFKFDFLLALRSTTQSLRLFLLF